MCFLKERTEVGKTSLIKIDLRFRKKWGPIYDHMGPYGPFNDDTLIGIDIEIYRHPTIEKLIKPRYRHPIYI